jgi:hypothetical protein
MFVGLSTPICHRIKGAKPKEKANFTLLDRLSGVGLPVRVIRWGTPQLGAPSGAFTELCLQFIFPSWTRYGVSSVLESVKVFQN